MALGQAGILSILLVAIEGGEVPEGSLGEVVVVSQLLLGVACVKQRLRVRAVLAHFREYLSILLQEVLLRLHRLVVRPELLKFVAVGLLENLRLVVNGIGFL